tara:strand:- start:18836 stop:20230 length:1395 start_codon:yes stop_codon:yes gene_type:complete
MTITLIGYLLLPVGIYGFLFSTKLLYKLTIFFLPFTASAIIYLGDDDASALLLTVFFGLLWIINSIVKLSIKKNLINSNFFIHKGIFLLVLFLFICFLSIFLIPLTDNFKIFSIDLGRFSPLVIKSYHINHLFFVTYGVLFAILLVNQNNNLNNIIETIKIYSYSIIFVILWGMFEVFSNVFGANFPYFIFNNTPSDSELGDSMRKLGEIGFFRMSSVGDEPSTIARSILIVIPVFITSYLYKISIFSRKIDNFVLLLMSIGILATASSSGISGFILVLVASIIIKAFLEERILRPALLLMFVSIFLVVLYLNNELFAAYFEYIFLGKLSSDSFFNRLATVTNSFDVFMSLPFFGAGFGSVTSDDLVIKLISNTGIFGLSVFILLLIITQAGLIKDMKLMKLVSKEMILFQVSICIIFFAYWLVTQIVGWSHQFQTGFFVLGLAFSLIRIKNSYKKEHISKLKI